jgi:hypothetical protein
MSFGEPQGRLPHRYDREDSLNRADDIFERRRRVLRGLLVGLAAFLALVGAGAWELKRVYMAQNAAILFDTPTARWIKADEPMDLNTHETAATRTVFHRVFQLFMVPAELTLRVRSFRDCRVFVNGIPLEPETRGSPHWVASDLYQIGSALREGRNEVSIAVENPRGPPALLVEGELPKLSTSPAWEVVSAEGGTTPVRLLSESPSDPIQGAFPSARDGLRRVAPFLAGAFLLGFVAASYRSAKGTLRPALTLTPSRLRWLLICAWTLLCTNGLIRLPPDIGSDAKGHLGYVGFILQYGRLPLAGDGWQAFQSPLYYLLTATLFRIATVFVPSPVAISYHVARLVPIFSGLALIEISYRSAIRVFRGRPDLQSLATVIAGTVPMSFYTCQEIGNEALAGALGAGVLYLCLREVTGPDRVSPLTNGALLGGLFGLTLLAKVSAVVMTPVLAWVLWHRFRARGVRSVLAAETGWVAATAFVSGWYFVRNWIYLGRPFIGGWDPARGIDWWQDPGYRTFPDLVRFGAAISRPMYAALAGLWDGIYSTLWLDGFASSRILRWAAPPWNYDFMVALSPMALPLSLAVIAGTVLIPATRGSSTRASLAVSAVAGLCFLAGIADHYLTVPFYTSPKATYALAMVPALGLLATNGLKGAVDSRWGRAVLSGYLSSWALCVFAAFFAG